MTARPPRLDGDALLAALAAGATLDATAAGAALVRRGRQIPVDAGVLADLAAQGLLAPGPNGRPAVTAAGTARLARRTAKAAPFLAQHRELAPDTVEVDGISAEVLRDADESPLAWLAQRKDKAGRPLIAPHQFAAGERLRADFTRAQMTPRVTANWEAAVAPGRRGEARDPAQFAEAVVAAKARLTRALNAAGPELAGLLLDVCCFLKGLEAVERERGWPARTAKVVLGLALDRLARHYGLSAEARGPAHGRIQAWSAQARE